MSSKYDYFREDMRPYLSGQVPSYRRFDALITRVRIANNLPIIQGDWPEYRALAFWRYDNQTHVRDNNLVTHDSAQVFNPNAEGYIDLERKLIEVWGSNPNPGPGPGPGPLPPLKQMRGNFLAAPFFAIEPKRQRPVMFEYPGLPASDQDAARQVMNHNSWSHLPLATKGGDWSRWAGWPQDYRFNYRDDLSRFKNEIVLPLRAEGVYVMLMVLGSGFSDAHWNMDSAKRMVDLHVTQLADVIDWWVPMWESDNVPFFKYNTSASREGK